MKVNVLFSNSFEDPEITASVVKNSVCAVIDTIRATSTITTILGCGGENILIASNIEEAYYLKSIFKDFILCGEINGLAPEGFNCGNSPLEISNINANKKNFILMTTNGTKSILKVFNSQKVYALSILNLYCVLDSVFNSALETESDILFLCSGEKGRVAYDDVYTAGLAVKYLLTKPYSFDYSDSSKIVLGLALSEFNIINALEKSCSARSLRKVGLGDDIAFLSEMNKYPVAPVLKFSTIKSKRNDVRDLSCENSFSFCKLPNQKTKNILYIITNEV